MKRTITNFHFIYLFNIFFHHQTKSNHKIFKRKSKKEQTEIRETVYQNAIKLEKNSREECRSRK